MAHVLKQRTIANAPLVNEVIIDTQPTLLTYYDIQSFLARALRARNFGGFTADCDTPRLPPFLFVVQTLLVIVTQPWLLGFF